MPHYVVTTPRFTLYWEGSEPEQVREWATVEAEDKRQALIRGAVSLRESGSAYMNLRSKDENPYRGLEVNEGKCKHGHCWCDFCTKRNDWIECPDCMREWYADDEEIK